jgi:hypothetical protein
VPRRPALTAFVACALLLWTAVAFWQETAAAARGREDDPRLYPSGWLLGGPQVEPLRRTLEAVSHRLPRGAAVAVDSQAWSHDQLHYLTMWCAYYLPRHEVIHREFLPRAGTSVSPVYLLTIPPRETPTGGTPVELPPGAHDPAILSLHRLEPPGRAGP